MSNDIYSAMSAELIAKAEKDLKELERQVKPMLKKELSKRAERRLEQRKNKL